MMLTSEQCGPLAGSCTASAIMIGVWVVLGVWIAWSLYRAWRER